MSLKYLFYNDYSEGAHPLLLEALSRKNLEQEAGYGMDRFCREAAFIIKEKAQAPNAEVFFVSAGTQANLTVLASILKPYESVIAPHTGHINVYEAGAIEATGHKIHPVIAREGKLTPQDVLEVVNTHVDEHMVHPRVVFISQPTELGTIYTKSELEDLSEVCKKKNLLLYLDGARLGSALASKSADFNLADIARLTDAFYIGGTKNGALLGEAIVISNPSLAENFRYHLKQRGALLAKGRVLGIQFLELFTDDLYVRLGRHANECAQRLAKGMTELGLKFESVSMTNQIFPILPNSVITDMERMYGFYVWSKFDDSHSVIRLVTSWNTSEEAVEMFLEDLRRVSR